MKFFKRHTIGSNIPEELGESLSWAKKDGTVSQTL